MNGDKPDIVILKKACGVAIVEVKDWNLKKYLIYTDNNWYIKKYPVNIKIKSPISQVFHYKQNLFD
ncbi:MAG: NERD domain-containing protein [Desulfovibrio sp.]|nr:NERD domain-containing protein [Desulfovibrio sp.]